MFFLNAEGFLTRLFGLFEIGYETSGRFGPLFWPSWAKNDTRARDFWPHLSRFRPQGAVSGPRVRDFWRSETFGRTRPKTAVGYETSGRQAPPPALGYETFGRSEPLAALGYETFRPKAAAPDY